MSRNLRDFRGVARPVGVVVTGLAVFIGLCAAVGGVWHALDPISDRRGGGSIALAIAAAITLVLGVALLLYGRRHAKQTITRREAVVSVAFIWLAAGVFGGIPFVLGAHMAPHDAFFEAISGFTTTGATVLTDIDGLQSRPLLLWRALIQWLGGMGIVVLFVAVFPNVGAGSKHMFRGEVPGTTAEGLVPRIAETSFALWRIYLAFTVLEVILLAAIGMPLFDSVAHALTTMSTGGFSPRDASIGAYDSAAIELVVSGFMILASVNFGLYFTALRTGSFRPFLRSLELKVFLFIVAVATLVVTISIVPLHDGNWFQAFRYALFQVATFASSTGYVTDEYMGYPAPALAIIIFLMFVGGSSGSTAGGMKVERIVLMVKQSWSEIHQSFRPAVVRVIRMGRQVVASDVLADVAAFFGIYMGTLGVLVVFVATVEPVSLPTAFGASLSCLSNMGPAPFHVEADNFAGYAPVTKIAFAIAMLLGRLEFFTLLALLVPEFWKR
ncbi:MAG: TrkH family potassium uptake protein [Myxococcota bacterium]